jgi:hypothetical protein
MAGALRVKHSLPLPDMFQAAAAMLSDTPILVTNDKALRKVKDVTLLSLEAFR